MSNKKSIKLVATVLAELFALATIIKVIGTGQWDRIFLASVTVLLVMLPALMEKLFRCEICLPVYIFGLFYAVGPMLGQCWNLYYTIHWWDRMLHVFGGIMFAIVGAYLFERLAQGKQKAITTALFALAFSISLAAVWEFVEFGADRLLGMDMQDDTVVDHICSYLLGAEPGVTGSIGKIESVVINGTPLSVGGYIDIGLFDSRWDMMLESLGAVITCLLLWLDKGKHSLIQATKK